MWPKYKGEKLIWSEKCVSFRGEKRGKKAKKEKKEKIVLRKCEKRKRKGT